jgi:hypothetical protein
LIYILFKLGKKSHGLNTSSESPSMFEGADTTEHIRKHKHSHFMFNLQVELVFKPEDVEHQAKVDIVKISSK